MKQDTFIQERYGMQPPFASFLPGIAGEEGIPLWCYYCNRGQAVSSFGLRDKDHAIMEFSPAHVAWENTRYKGFRTFLRYKEEDSKWTIAEAFADDAGALRIRPNELELHWENGVFAVNVVYFVVPGCRVGALARQVCVTNVSDQFHAVELVDGMPAIVCAGVNQDSLKNMTQLSKAWMQVELDTDSTGTLPYYRVRYSMADTATVHEIQEGNFALTMDEQGTRKAPFVDPETIFGWDTSLTRPLGMEMGMGEMNERRMREATSNLFPCAMFRRIGGLQPGESLTLNELYGHADSKETLLSQLGLQTVLDAAWFDKKRREASALAERLTAVIAGKTADPTFDAYSRQSYLDNLLRGGEPIRFADGEKQNIYYLYSRKHGDMEREYNYFVMSPEFYSQGNGNFRDVCQNRRCDVLFHPWVGDANIRTFFSLFQSDGYNPLVIDRMTFRVPEEEREGWLQKAPGNEALRQLLQEDFTPGQLALALGEGGRELLRPILASAQSEPNADFGEGYWCDHWTYSLDLIESYLAVWPEKKRELLFGEADYPWYETRALILPYEQRCEKRENGLRQVRFLDMERKANRTEKWMREQYGDGEIACSTLMEKLVVLCALKYATLDRVGIGIEMEGGKPGWYDALNGLPGLSGSSVAETCELKRLLSFTAAALEEQDGEIVLYDEMADLLLALAGLTGDAEARWRQTCALRADYRQRTADGVSGDQTVMPARDAAALLRGFEDVVNDGLRRAVEMGGGICPTYLMFPQEKAEVLPLFLEGQVRWLKLDLPLEEKRQMAERVRSSGLYDDKLGMYKVNESLKPLTFEAGRCKAFTPGWLENESIWLHMEYKYLLELLRSGLYEEYERAFDTALVPFMDPAVYGRSVYENVSFIVSSANPNPALHGRGFVARLSGSTVEFLSMWQLMMFGPAPFTLEDGRLALRFQPMLPARLIPEDGVVEATFLGQCTVRYHILCAGSLIPGAYTVEEITADGTAYPGDTLPEAAARDVREGRIQTIDVRIRR